MARKAKKVKLESPWKQVPVSGGVLIPNPKYPNDPRALILVGKVPNSQSGSLYIPGPTAPSPGKTRSHGKPRIGGNNRKEKNKRGVTPRQFLIQRIPNQISGLIRTNEGPMVVNVKTNSYRKVQRLRAEALGIVPANVTAEEK